MAASTFSISKILSLTGETETEPGNAEMITQTAALVHPSAEAQSGSGLLGRLESLAGTGEKNTLKAIIMIRMANQVQILAPVNFPSPRPGNISEQQQLGW